MMIESARHADLGVRTFINAAGTYTRLGGSRMPPAVVEAMAEAARYFVDIDELQVAVGARIAEITRNEAAYVTCGAAAGLLLATAACMIAPDPARAHQLPDTRGLKRRVVVQRAHRNPYDVAVRTLGIELVEVGYPNAIVPPLPADLEAAIDGQTAAVLHVLAGWTSAGALDLAAVIRIAHARGVPVIVDAAAQLPPKANLWELTGMGTDLVLFSGGKDLRGPQSSGLILGRRDLVDLCAVIGAPHHGVGRPLKVGKEELLGLLAAVELYLEGEEEARLARDEALVARIIAELAGPAIDVARCFPNEAGQPLPRVRLRFLGPDAVSRCARAIALLRAGDPSIEVAPAEPDGFYVNPMTVDPWEEGALLTGLVAALRRVREECSSGQA
jgi:L-seryl-tRNA(Ser) seleniumtransferase